MEENKVNSEKSKKLSYEALENAARQISVQADALFKENKELRNQVEALSLSNLYTELNFRFKVLEYAGFFSTEFVGRCVDTIEKAMTPDSAEEVENPEEPVEEDNKE